MSRDDRNHSPTFRLHGPLPPQARALFVIASLLIGGAAALLTQRLVFRATATRVEGTVIDHDNRGRPVVEYSWAGQPFHCKEQGPSADLPIGTTIGIYVPPDGPSGARLGGLIPLLFMPAWTCVMPAMLLSAYGLIVALRGNRRLAKVGDANEVRN